MHKSIKGAAARRAPPRKAGAKPAPRKADARKPADPKPKREAPDRANTTRGEHELKMAGRRWPLRLSYTAIVAIESKAGAIIDLARACQTGAITYHEAAIVATEFIRAGAEPGSLDSHVGAERIGAMIYEEGLPAIAATLAVALVDAATGGRTSTGEAKAVAKGSGETATAE